MCVRMGIQHAGRQIELTSESFFNGVLFFIGHSFHEHCFESAFFYWVLYAAATAAAVAAVLTAAAACLALNQLDGASADAVASGGLQEGPIGSMRAESSRRRSWRSYRSYRSYCDYRSYLLTSRSVSKCTTFGVSPLFDSAASSIGCMQQACLQAGALVGSSSISSTSRLLVNLEDFCR